MSARWNVLSGGASAPDVIGVTSAVLTALGEARAEIDALNVFPVADADTGTNLYLTFEAALRAMPADAPSAGEAIRAGVAGALLGARGGSGVIVAQLLRGAAESLEGPAVGAADVLRRAMVAASDAAWAAVAQPVEGTILSVVAAAAEGARTSNEPDATAVLRDAVRAAREALLATTDQLEVLRDAGVVDAGGRGLVVLLDSLLESVTGIAAPAFVSPPAVRREGGFRVRAAGDRRRPQQGPAFEVVYLLEADTAAVVVLREDLLPLGDSLFVGGSDPLWRVHVHVDDVGAAIEAGLRAGRPRDISVTHFGDQRARGVREVLLTGHAVVALSPGPGLSAVLEEAGAFVVYSPPGHRPTSGDLLAAVRRTDRCEVVLLPHHQALAAVAQATAAAARSEGIRVAVVPTAAAVQVLAAVAVHDPERRFGEDVIAMTAAATSTRFGGVTIATAEGLTMAGVCHPGDLLGMVGGDIAEIRAASDPAGRRDVIDEVAVAVLERLLGPGGELVTLVSGADADSELTGRLVTYLATAHADVDVTVLDGGQPRHLLLVGVE